MAVLPRHGESDRHKAEIVNDSSWSGRPGPPAPRAPPLLKQAPPPGRLIVDLRNTTFIDKKSEKVLVHMKHGGAQFIACGISTTHQLEDLGILCKGAMSNLH